MDFNDNFGEKKGEKRRRNFGEFMNEYVECSEDNDKVTGVGIRKVIVCNRVVENVMRELGMSGSCVWDEG